MHFLKNYSSLFLIFTLLIPTFSRAMSKREMVRESLELSGRTDFLKHLSKHLNRAFDQAIDIQKANQVETAAIQHTLKVRDIYVRAAGSYNFRNLLEENMAKHIPLDVLEKVMTWHQTDFAKAIAVEEHTAHAPEVAMEFQKFAEKFQLIPPGEYRSELIARLDSVSNKTLFQEELAVLVAEKISYGLNMGKPEVLRKPASELRMELGKKEPLVRKRASFNSKMKLHFAYRNLSNKQIIEYLKFMESKAGRVYAKTFSHLVKYGLRQALQNSDPQVGKIISR